MIAPSEWEAIRAEYRAARAVEQAAQERMDRARRALMDAQCGVRYAETTDASGQRRVQFCTLPTGHPGSEHGKDPIDRVTPLVRVV